MGGREAMAQQVPGFGQRWFGRMHRIDKFFHHVPPPPGTALQTPHSARARPGLYAVRLASAPPFNIVTYHTDVKA